MRADKFLAEKFGSRTKAAQELESGRVLLNGKTLKPKDELKEGDEPTFIEPKERFVSNGGYKLARAFEVFSFDPTGKVFADIGASTGGFTDCLIQNGAKTVFAIDVGENLLDKTLKINKKIIFFENCNARYLTKNDFSVKIDGVVTDVSFISLRLILPAIAEILDEEGDAFVLIKPQFECEKKNIGKSGIVSLGAHPKILKKVLGYARESGLKPCEIVNAPVRKKKNVEYVLHLRKRGGCSDEEILESAESFLTAELSGDGAHESRDLYS